MTIFPEAFQLLSKILANFRNRSLIGKYTRERIPGPLWDTCLHVLLVWWLSNYYDMYKQLVL
jgi:hypothetical protein